MTPDSPRHRRFTDLIVQDGPQRHRFVPDLYYDHGGYWKVVLSLLLVHFGLAIDSLRDDTHNTLIFRVLDEAFYNHLVILAALHALIGVLIVAGLYWRGHFVLLRVGAGMSFILFNAIAVAFTAAAIKYNLSVYSAMASITLSLSSLAAFKEPPIQIARRK